MLLSGVHLNGSFGVAHRAVYQPLDASPRIRRAPGTYPDYVTNALNISPSNPYVWKTAARVVLLDTLYRKTLSSIERREDLPEAFRQMLPALKTCLPAGVRFAEKKKSLYCRKYAFCPWCRFRKAVGLADKLKAHRKETRQIAAITLSMPMPLVSLAPETFMHDHKALVLSLGKKNREFFGSQPVTIPVWRQSGVDKRHWVLHIQTTIIGLMKDQADLPLPEDRLTVERNCTRSRSRCESVYRSASQRS